jgi:DAACS family dicarboxylate/amino acid:cation (Na+ or H+) symporter
MAESDPKLANRILTGLAVGALAGIAVLLIGARVPALLEGARALSTAVFDPLGQVFLRMLFFVVMPLVFASLAAGVAQLGQLSRLGPLAGRTFTLFFLNMSVAVLLGMVMMNVVQPGAAVDADTKARLVAEYGGASAKHIERQAQQERQTQAHTPRLVHGPKHHHNGEHIGQPIPAQQTQQHMK